MDLVIISNQLNNYLYADSQVIDVYHPLVWRQVEELKGLGLSPVEKAEIVFQFVRDDIHHSFDTGNSVVSTSASDTLRHGEGICFAKSHLLAAILRGLNIPTGFCYQRVLREHTVDAGYVLHGLNAIYIEEYGWFRVDPRGNKEGISSSFSIKTEDLAYPIRKELGEIDYPYVFPHPLQEVIEAMQHSVDCTELFFNRPDSFVLS